MGIPQTNRAIQSYGVEPSVGADPTVVRSLGPNSFGDFGAQIRTVARDPISPNNQREAGTIVDKESTATFEGDAVLDHLDDFLEGAVRSLFTGPQKSSPTAATATAFTVPAGAVLPASTLVYVRGSPIASNNGLKVVDALSTATSIIIVGGLTAESYTAAQGVTVEVCGFRFAASDLTVNAAGNLVSVAKDMTTLGLANGQMLWVGGDAAAAHAFATAANRGFVRVNGTITTTIIPIDKKSQAFATDAGTGKTIDLYFGRQLRVVPLTDANYLERTYMFEVVYNKLGAGDVDAYEYVKGNAISEFTVTMPKTDKVTMSVAFIGTDSDVPTVTRKGVFATPVKQNATVALNTVADMLRGRIQKADGTGYTSYITSVNLKLVTGATRNTAHGVLGSVVTSFGNQEIDLDVNAFFTNKDVITALNTNEAVTADWCLRNADGAVCFDVPECRLGGGKRNFPQNEVVNIDLAVAANRDPIFNTSLIVSRLPYCPAS